MPSSTTPPLAPLTGQSIVDARNAEFWDELCGTSLARHLGIEDHSEASLRKFDEWYFNFYPYLARHIPFERIKGRRVLEVGLGYGTVAQRLAESGADYFGLDIADGPVAMTNHRLRRQGLAGEASRGSILAAPFEGASFDLIVAIGCYHHTGDLRRAFNESYRLLRRGGELVAMVYNVYSYRRWLNVFVPTFRYLLWDYFRACKLPSVSSAERGAYDSDITGDAAPYTDFVSRHHLRRICGNFSEVEVRLENIDQEKPFRNRPRIELLNTAWPSICGLDIYLRARK